MMEYIALYLALSCVSVFILNFAVEPWLSTYSFEKGKVSDVWWLFNIAMFVFWPLLGPFFGAVKYGQFTRQKIRDDLNNQFNTDGNPQ